MRLTKRKALEITVELWTWLAETGSDQKSDWPGWHEYGEMEADCALCEYDAQRANDCQHCPLLGKWRYAKYCYWDGSPFEDWDIEDDATLRKLYAQEIVDLCKKELEALRK
jgi:hypothetical protein